MLPLGRAKAYDRLEWEAIEFTRVSSTSSIEDAELSGTLRSLNVGFDPGETLHLSPQQRDELVRAINKNLQLQYWVAERLAFWKGASRAVLDNVQDQDVIQSYMLKEVSALKQP